MKYLQALVIVTLFAVSVYLYTDRVASIASLSTRIATIEATLKKDKEACETRMAYLKMEKVRQSCEPVLKRRQVPLLDVVKNDIVKKLPTDPEKVRKEAIRDMVDNLKLDETQEIQVRKVLLDFEKAKTKVFEKSRKEKRFIFEMRYLHMINEARREAMAAFAGFLTEEQLALMKEKDYDLKLGLRELQKHGLKSP